MDANHKGMKSRKGGNEPQTEVRQVAAAAWNVVWARKAELWPRMPTSKQWTAQVRRDMLRMQEAVLRAGYSAMPDAWRVDHLKAIADDIGRTAASPAAADRKFDLLGRWLRTSVQGSGMLGELARARIKAMDAIQMRTGLRVGARIKRVRMAGGEEGATIDGSRLGVALRDRLIEVNRKRGYEATVLAIRAYDQWRGLTLDDLPRLRPERHSLQGGWLEVRSLSGKGVRQIRITTNADRALVHDLVEYVKRNGRDTLWPHDIDKDALAKSIRNRIDYQRRKLQPAAATDGETGHE